MGYIKGVNSSKGMRFSDRKIVNGDAVVSKDEFLEDFKQQFGDGGTKPKVPKKKEPIYVDSIDDPRYKAYIEYKKVRQYYKNLSESIEDRAYTKREWEEIRQKAGINSLTDSSLDLAYNYAYEFTPKNRSGMTTEYPRTVNGEELEHIKGGHSFDTWNEPKVEILVKDGAEETYNSQAIPKMESKEIDTTPTVSINELSVLPPAKPTEKAPRVFMNARAGEIVEGKTYWELDPVTKKQRLVTPETTNASYGYKPKPFEDGGVKGKLKKKIAEFNFLQEYNNI